VARQIAIPGHGVIVEDGEREYMVPGVGLFKEEQPAAAAGRIMGSLAGKGGLAGPGGIAGIGGGLAA